MIGTMATKRKAATRAIPQRVHLVGIGGVHMSAIAHILMTWGHQVSGSDLRLSPFTERLAEQGATVYEGHNAANVDDAELVVTTSAATKDNPEIGEAQRRGIPVIKRADMVARLMEGRYSIAIAGTHGKTTTTALTGVLLDALKLPATVLAGSEVLDFGGRSTLLRGERYFVAETCEYRRHFLNFRPRRVVITNVEADHLDYFRDLADVLAAFVSYARLLPPQGALIYCADDPGARSVAERLRTERPEVRLLPYGETAEGPFRVYELSSGDGRTTFRLEGFPGEFALRRPGRHLALNAAGALALAVDLLTGEQRSLGFEGLEGARSALAGFRGSRRRTEVVGEAGSVLFIDDYAHHPTEIRTTLAGLKSFYPGRRLVVDFMPHTFSRTRALLPEFAGCFAAADEVILHRVYASARELDNGGGADGGTLYRAVAARHPAVRYFEEPLEAVDELSGGLRAGDLFVTMGAGDNWKVGRALLARRGGAA